MRPRQYFSRVAVDLQFQEVGGAGNAGIVIADCLLALPGGFIQRPRDQVRSVLAEIVFNPPLILGRWRDDLGRQDQPVFIQGITMVKNAALSFGDRLPGARAIWRLNSRRSWRFV